MTESGRHQTVHGGWDEWCWTGNNEPLTGILMSADVRPRFSSCDSIMYLHTQQTFMNINEHSRHSITVLTGRRGSAVTCLTEVWEDQGLNPTVGSYRFSVKKPTMIYSLGHGLHNLTGVPKSTQPSTLRGIVKWVSAFRLSNNNKWRWWVWLMAAYRQTHSPGCLTRAEGSRPLGTVPYSLYEPGELLPWL